MKWNDDPGVGQGRYQGYRTEVNWEALLVWSVTWVAFFCALGEIFYGDWSSLSEFVGSLLNAIWNYRFRMP